LSIIFFPTGGWNDEGEDIGPVTVTRAEKVREIWKNNPEMRILITACSRGSNLEKPICEVAKSWLVRKGIPNNRIVIFPESRADNSIAEVKEAARLIKTAHLSRSVVVISSWWHIPRLMTIWREYGDGIKPRFVTTDWRWSGIKRIPMELRGTWAVLKKQASPRYVQQ